MTDAGVVHKYLLGFAAALVCVVLAATLVVIIIDHARAILGSVAQSKRATSGIAANVAAIADLRATSATADRILAGALLIESHVHLVADTIEARASSGVGGR